MTTHFNPTPAETKIQKCGTLLTSGQTTTDHEKVTCKRCIKRLEIGTATTGKLAK